MVLVRDRLYLHGDSMDALTVMYLIHQEANKELRSKQLESETKAETPTIELFDFKAKFAETKAFAKVSFCCLTFKKKNLLNLCWSVSIRMKSSDINYIETHGTNVLISTQLL